MKKKRRKFRWLRIVFLYIPIVLLGLFILFMLFLRWFFPNEQARSFLVKELEIATQKPVSIERVRLNPFGSLDFQSIVIGHQEINADSGDFYLKTESIRVYYHLASLLRKQFRIAGIQIEEPQIILSAIPATVDSTLLEEKAATFADSAAAISPLPLSFNMKKLSIRNLSFTYIIPDSVSDIIGSINGVNLELSELDVPRNILTAPDKIHGRLKLSVDNGNIQFSQQDETHTIIPNLDLDIVNRSSGWAIEGDIGLISTTEDVIELGAGLKIDGKGLGEKINIHHLKLFLNETSLLQCTGEINQFTTSPEFDMDFQSDGVHLESLVSSARTVLPESMIEQLPQFHVRGTLKPAQGEFKGTLEKASFSYQLSLDQGRLLILEPHLDCQDITFNLSAQGSGSIDHLMKGALDTDLAVGKVSMQMPDSSFLAVQDVAFSIKSEMDSLILPEHIICSGSVREILDGTLNIKFQLDRMNPAGHWLFPYETEGYILADSLSLQQLPAISPDLSGKINLITHFKSQSTDPIVFHLSAISSEIIYPSGETQDTTEQLMLSSSLYMGGDPESMSWNLDSAEFKINDVLHVRSSGQIDTVGFQGRIDEIVIQNDALISMLPNAIKKDIEGLSVKGEERLKGSFRGYLDSEIPPWFSGELIFSDVQAQWPAMGISLQNMDGTIGIEGTSEHLQSTGNINLYQLGMKDWRHEPVETITLGLNGSMLIPDYVIMDEITLSSESLGLNIFSRFEAIHLDKNPAMRIDVKLHFDHSDTLEIAEQIYTKGNLSCFLHGMIQDPEKQYYQIHGDISSTGLDIFNPVFKLENLFGSFPFQIDADLKKMKLIQPDNLHIYNRRDYAKWRSLYKQRFPTLKTIQIHAINAQGFIAENIEMDIDISQSMIQVPYFNINLFEGNLGGGFYINLGDGNPDNIAYVFDAQAARINSAAIDRSSTLVRGTSELNATLSIDGLGLNVEKGIDVDGYFHITKIGPKFASTLLRQMNPEGKDRGMTMTRRLLDTGWKPKRFVFDIRHGYVYPSLSLSQPWFSPVRIPGELEYGRIPIEFFFQNINSQ